MSVLLTGGAGYIGAHVLDELLTAGEDVVVLDDLSTGRAERVTDAPLLRIDLASRGAGAALRRAMRVHSVDAVVHLAGKKRVDESVRRPVLYFQQNVGGLAEVVAAMESESVPHLVFSSSAAVYGDVDGTAVSEDAVLHPMNPYGRSKLAGEWMVEDATAAGTVRGCSLRYFNVAGAGDPALLDADGTNLIPAVIRRVGEGRPPLVFGTDYPTPDGTCVRDFVHVVDLARAHVTALAGLRTGVAGSAYNVGTGRGSSVREVIDEIARQLGRPVVTEDLARRAGDPASVVAAVERIRADLDWSATLGLEDMVASSLLGMLAAPARR